jgi:hypothetical protein
MYSDLTYYQTTPEASSLGSCTNYNTTYINSIRQCYHIVQLKDNSKNNSKFGLNLLCLLGIHDQASQCM